MPKESDTCNAPCSRDMDQENFILNMLFVTSVAEDPSGATVCTTQWNKNQSCYTPCICISYANLSEYSLNSLKDK